MEQHPLYAKEAKKNQIFLSEEQKGVVRDITLGIEEVDENIRELAVGDVIKTIENGHPLNRVITDNEGKINGYIACEDFVPKEAYIKYLGSTKQTGRNFLLEIPAFLEYAKNQGYSKLNFHGWNERLNHILERYGFERIKTDSMNNLNIDFYEKSLVETKSEEEVDKQRMDAFEQKYVTMLRKLIEDTKNTYKQEEREDISQKTKEIGDKIINRIKQENNFEIKERNTLILNLKLLRHFQNNDGIDENTLYDAIIETPNFINTDKGSFFRLLEVHEEKTLQKIAEIRKQRAEIKGTEKTNPYEALFPTKSGDYYMARLLNMPHLEEESAYMNHCVGTSDSYVNKIKRGEVEILSFRNSPKIKDNKLEGDTPLMTIEYNLKTKVIQQMKKNSDAYLDQNDPYFNDVIDALKQLRTTKTDTGELRDFKQISSSEMQNFKVKDYHILTEHGEINFRDFNPNDNTFVLKIGMMEITPKTSKEDASKIMKIVGNVDVAPDQIAYGTSEINENTKAHIGEWNPEISKKIPENVEYLYESFPDKKILRTTIELSTKSPEEYTRELETGGFQIYDYTKDMLNKTETLKQKEKVDLVSFSVGQLGFPNGATLQQIYDKAKELDLELCPPQVGPELRLNYKDQPNGEWLRIAMEAISDRDGFPRIFIMGSGDGALWLDDYWSDLGFEWGSDDRFVFRSRKN